MSKVKWTDTSSDEDTVSTNSTVKKGSVCSSMEIIAEECEPGIKYSETYGCLEIYEEEELEDVTDFVKQVQKTMTQYFQKDVLDTLKDKDDEYHDNSMIQKTMTQFFHDKTLTKSAVSEKL